jgi:S-methylmethionine-dependent homocysteine/selenocysteine methylase
MVAYGHIGNAIPLPGWSYAHGAAPAEYARAASAWLDLGARVVGGCCGTSPAHVRALRGLVDARRRPPAPGPGTLV